MDLYQALLSSQKSDGHIRPSDAIIMLSEGL
jgi:hypothetical protein